MKRRPHVPVDWFGAPAWRLHATLVAGVALCTFASWAEWTRALSGHTIAWVYAFEWPLFALMGGYVWWRLLHEHEPAVIAQGEVTSDDDPELAAWQDYLQRLHTADPPGGPPS